MTNRKSIVVRVVKPNDFVVSITGVVIDHYIEFHKVPHETKVDTLYEVLLSRKQTIYDIRSTMDRNLFKTY